MNQENFLVGQKFNRLSVIKRIAPKRKDPAGMKVAWWECLCECGRIKEATTGHLISGRIKSCGCLALEEAIRREDRYLIPKDKLSAIARSERIYRLMIKRCTDKNFPSFRYYGERGITVCERWMKSHDEFLKDMGLRPTIHHQLDRIDNNKGYSPENCRWVTRSENNRNKRTNVYAIIDGDVLCLADIAIKLGVPRTHISRRRRLYGESPQEAVDYFVKKKEKESKNS